MASFSALEPNVKSEPSLSAHKRDWFCALRSQVLLAKGSQIFHIYLKLWRLWLGRAIMFGEAQLLTVKQFLLDVGIYC